MKPIKVLFTSILILTTLLHANGNSRLPIAKKQFELTYEDISNGRPVRVRYKLTIVFE